jgi:hypothetical protein
MKKTMPALRCLSVLSILVLSLDVSAASAKGPPNLAGANQRRQSKTSSLGL